MSCRELRCSGKWPLSIPWSTISSKRMMLEASETLLPSFKSLPTGDSKLSKTDRALIATHDYSKILCEACSEVLRLLNG